MVRLSLCRVLLRQVQQQRDGVLSATETTELSSKPLKPKSSWSRKKTFIDSLRIQVRGGAGGQGFLKYGGLGGKGGDVVVKSHKHKTLKILAEQNPSRRFVATTGENSQKRKLVGTEGKDRIISVPVGVTVKNGAGRVIGDLNEPSQAIRVARGGAGGSPDNNFLGQKGEVQMIQLDLKLLADIGLVGFPNAGKSTFLSAVSRASPKIANYPFTTVQPQLGVMEFSDQRQISVADLPGLIEGAHVNVGMGHRFLKHVERTKLLLFMIDINGFQLPRREHFRTAFETVLLLNKELELYKPELLDKPAVLAINKIDTIHGSTAIDDIKECLAKLPDSAEDVDESIVPSQCVHFDDIVSISAQSGHGVEELKFKLRGLLDVYADRELLKTNGCKTLQQIPSFSQIEHNKSGII